MIHIGKKAILLSIVATMWAYGSWEEAGRIVGDPETVDFGHSVDFDGQYAAVGDPGENAVYIFKADENGQWQRFDKIVDPYIGNPLYIASFYLEIGTDVAIDDQSDIHGSDVYLAIGSPKVDIIRRFSQVIGNLSAVLLYHYNPNQNESFEHVQSFATNDYNTSGTAVSLGSYVKNVGEFPHFIRVHYTLLASGEPNNGQVKLYYHDDYTENDDWNQTVITREGGDGTLFGYDVSLLPLAYDEIYLGVGAPGEDVTHTNALTHETKTYQGKGAAYLYWIKEDYDAQLNPIYSWEEKRFTQYIPDLLIGNQGVTEDSAFGTSVDLETNGTSVRYIAGALKTSIGFKNFPDPTDVIASKGEAIVYERTQQPPNWQWSRVGSALHGSSISSLAEEYGKRVAVRGNLAVVSAPSYNNGKGAVFAYDYNGNEWIARPPLSPEDADHFGSDVTIVDDTVVSGNSGGKNVSGYTYKPTPDINPGILMYLLN